MAIVAIVNMQKATRVSSPPPPPPPPPGSPSPPPTPTTPALVVTPRSYSWLWWIVVILVAIIAYHYIVAPALRTSAPAPQATAPKRELKQYVVPCNLRFVGGDGAVERSGLIGVRKGGRAFFVTHSSPWRNEAVFHVVVKILQENTSEIFIKINGGITKSLVRPGSTDFTNVVFFEAGEAGNPSYFNPTGINNIEIWTSGDNMVIQRVSIEMIYRN